MKRCTTLLGLTVLAIVAVAGPVDEATTAPPEAPAVVAMKAAMHAALKEANPEYKNDGEFRFREGKLFAISLMRCRVVQDISPLAQFPLSSVRSVILYGAGDVSDLSPLRECRLTQLNTERCDRFSDLSPLRGMPMTGFRMYACSSVKDISPLEGMPLRHFDMGKCPLIEDVSALQGMPMQDLRMDECPKIKDISIVKDMPLKFLSLFGCTGIKDYSPLAELRLETLLISPEFLSDDEIEMVRRMDSLKLIARDWKEWSAKQSADEFWKKFDQEKVRAKETEHAKGTGK